MSRCGKVCLFLPLLLFILFSQGKGDTCKGKAEGVAYKSTLEAPVEPYYDYYVCLWNPMYQIWLFYPFTCPLSYVDSSGAYVNTFDESTKKCMSQVQSALPTRNMYGGSSLTKK